MVSTNSSRITRSSLIRRAGDREADAWCEVVDLYGPLIAHWCRRCGLDSHAAADCVQDVFAAVSVSLAAFEPTRAAGSFRAWLWTITRRKVLDQLRSKGRRPNAFGGSTAAVKFQEVVDASTIPDDEPTADDQIQRLLQRALQQVQGEFESKTWQAFTRSVIDGLPTDVVATELNLAPATVRQARSRVLRKLRQQLGDL